MSNFIQRKMLMLCLYQDIPHVMSQDNLFSLFQVMWWYHPWKLTSIWIKLSWMITKQKGKCYNNDKINLSRLDFSWSTNVHILAQMFVVSFKKKNLLRCTNILCCPVWGHIRVHIFNKPISYEPTEFLGITTKYLPRELLSAMEKVSKVERIFFFIVVHFVYRFKFQCQWFQRGRVR